VYPDKRERKRECGYDVSWWTETEDQLELVFAVERMGKCSGVNAGESGVKKAEQ
jgi:hypothetical protein